jgi:RNA-directed DNA polymerase
MNLVQIAEIHGINSSRVQRQQEILARSLLFRIAAVSILMVKKGSKTPGIDNQTLSVKSSVQEKIELVDYLLYSLNSGYKASSGKRHFILKSNGKKRPLGIPTIKDRALQTLINSVLLPLVEMNSDTQSYGFRPYRSAKNAVSILRAQLKSNRGDENK